MNDGTLLYSSVLSLCWREGRRAEEEGDSREKERREKKERGRRGKWWGEMGRINKLFSA